MPGQPLVLVTGASGFVGRATLQALVRAGIGSRAVVRRPGQLTGNVVVADLARPVEWPALLRDVTHVIHLAARVHVMRDTAADPLAAFRAINRDVTLALAGAAAQSGVRRFIYVSTIKVLAESTAGRPLTEQSPPAPSDPYAVSKWEAEQGLREIERRMGFPVTVVRPPLVYGPGVGGNLHRLMALIARGIPLPLGAVNNRRTMIGVENLADLLVRAAGADVAAGKTFLAGDDRSLSTAELVRALAAGLGRPSRLVPIPPALLRLVGVMTGRGDEVKRLTESLEVDNAYARRVLDWVPPVAVERGIEAMTRAFRERA